MENTITENSSNIRIEYTEVTLAQVLQYFVNGYKLQSGTIISHDSFVDIAKGKVVFKLCIEEPHNEK